MNGLVPLHQIQTWHMDSPPLLPASDADETGDISTPIQTPTRKRKSQRKWPLYAEGDLFPIIRHLIVCLDQATITLKTFQRMNTGRPSHKAIRGQVLYWEHVCATIKWMIHKAYQPQRHLKEIGREKWQEILVKVLSDCEK